MTSFSLIPTREHEADRAGFSTERKKVIWERLRTLPLFSRLNDSSDLSQLREVADHLRNFEDVMVLGVGGSSLGGQVLLDIRPEDEAYPWVHFPDNLDARTFEGLLSEIDLQKAAFVVVSKSGGTAETLMQTMRAMTVLRDQLGEGAIKERFVVITEEADNPVTRLAERHNLKRIAHPDDIGGRFSVFTSVGLLPCYTMGLDGAALRQGALNYLALGIDMPAFDTAISLFAAHLQGLRQRVVMAYDDRLEALTRWCRQLWAESLGKAGKGSTLIRAMGPVDQHSQLQLYIDGPADKFFTLIGTKQEKMPHLDLSLAGNDPALSWMANRSMADLVEAEFRGTRDTLLAHGKPLETLVLDNLDERAIGELLMHFMVECILMAHLMSVDPFDQPAVEHGKQRARDWLARM